MERILITIGTANAAFDESPVTEIGRILRKLAEEFESQGIPNGTLRDINGNACGTVQIE